MFSTVQRALATPYAVAGFTILTAASVRAIHTVNRWPEGELEDHRAIRILSEREWGRWTPSPATARKLVVTSLAISTFAAVWLTMHCWDRLDPACTGDLTIPIGMLPALYFQMGWYGEPVQLPWLLNSMTVLYSLGSSLLIGSAGAKWLGWGTLVATPAILLWPDR